MLALVLVAAQTSFTPALEHGSRPVAEWLRELDHPERATDAAWCVYYADDRSPAALDALRAALATPEAPWAHQAIDAILAAWGVGFEPLLAEAFFSAGGRKAPESLFELPESAIPGTPEQLLAWVYADDARFALGAAVTLLARDKHTQRALAWFGRAFDADRLDPATLIWLRQQARRGWGEVLGERITRAVAEGCTDDVDIARCSTELALAAVCVPGAADALVDLAATEGIHAPEAAELLRAASGTSLQDTLRDDWFHASWMEPVDDPELETALARHYGTLIAESARERRVSPGLLAALNMRVPRYPAIAAAIEPGLVDLLDLDTEERLEVLRLLGHVRCADPRVRTAWLETARGWSAFSKKTVWSFPCPPTRDGEVLSILSDALRKTETLSAFKDKLRFVGQTDAAQSPDVRWLLDHLGPDPWAWAMLVTEGFRGVVNEPLDLPEELVAEGVDHKKARALRMYRLALNCATRKDRAEDVAADEEAIVEMLELDYPYGGAGGYYDYVAIGYRLAQTLGLGSDRLARCALRHIRMEFPMGYGWSTHADAARAYLEVTALSIGLQVEVERHIRYHEPVPGPHSFNRVNQLYSGRPTGQVALQRTPQIRRALYQGNIRALDELSRCTRLVDRDLDYLEAVLARGPAEVRAWTLRLVERDRIDAPRVRDAVRRRVGDVDGEVRHRARTLIETMDW